MQVTLVPIAKIKPHPRNPRLEYRQDVVDGIVANINGEMLPDYALRVRPIEGGYFEIVSGHHRWQAGLKKGLKELPCWVREMSDEDAYMSLVTDNAQGELSPLEIGKHVFGIPKGNKWSGPTGKEYAKAINKDPGFLSRVKGAYEVLEFVKLQHCNLTDPYMHLYAIHALPRELWPNFVELVLTSEASVAQTQAAVGRATDYIADPVEGHAFLPVNDCALAVGIGTHDADDFLTIAGLVDAAVEALEKEKDSEAKIAELKGWLEAHVGGEAWDYERVKAKIKKLLPVSPVPKTAYKLIAKEFDALRILKSTVESRPEDKGWGGFSLVCATFTKEQRREFYFTLEPTVEHLQEWLETLKGFPDDE